MTSARSEKLLALVRSLLEESERAVDGELEEATSLLRSGLLDSLSLLQIAEWVSAELGGELDLESANIREEWDCVADILAFIDRHSPP